MSKKKISKHIALALTTGVMTSVMMSGHPVLAGASTNEYGNKSANSYDITTLSKDGMGLPKDRLSLTLTATQGDITLANPGDVRTQYGAEVNLVAQKNIDIKGAVYESDQSSLSLEAKTGDIKIEGLHKTNGSGEKTEVVLSNAKLKVNSLEGSNTFGGEFMIKDASDLTVAAKNKNTFEKTILPQEQSKLLVVSKEGTNTFKGILAYGKPGTYKDINGERNVTSTGIDKSIFPQDMEKISGRVNVIGNENIFNAGPSDARPGVGEFSIRLHAASNMNVVAATNNTTNGDIVVNPSTALNMTAKEGENKMESTIYVGSDPKSMTWAPGEIKGSNINDIPELKQAQFKVDGQTGNSLTGKLVVGAKDDKLYDKDFSATAELTTETGKNTVTGTVEANRETTTVNLTSKNAAEDANKVDEIISNTSANINLTSSAGGNTIGTITTEGGNVTATAGDKGNTANTINAQGGGAVSLNTKTGSNTVTGAISSNKGASVVLTTEAVAPENSGAEGEQTPKVGNTVASLSTDGGQIKLNATKAVNTVSGNINAINGTHQQPDNTMTNSDIVVNGKTNDIAGEVTATDSGYIWLGTTDGNALNNTITMQTNGKVAVYADKGENKINGEVKIGTKGAQDDKSEFKVTNNNGNNTFAKAITAESGNMITDATKGNNTFEDQVNLSNKATIAAKGVDNTFKNVAADTGATLTATGKNNTFGDITSDNGANITATVNQAGGKNTAASVATSDKGTTSFGHADGVTDSANEITGNVTLKGEGSLNLDAGTKGNTIGGTVEATKSDSNNKGGSLTLKTTGDNKVVGNVTADNEATIAATGVNNTFADVSADHGTRVTATGTNNTFGNITSGNGANLTAKVNAEGGKNTASSVTTSNTGTTSFGADTDKGIKNFGNEINGPVTAKDGGTINLTAGEMGNKVTGDVTLSDKDKEKSGGTLNLTANNGDNTLTGNVDAKNGGTLAANGNDNTFANVTADNGANITATGTNNTFGDLDSNNDSHITANVNKAGGKNTAASVKTANTGTTSFGGANGVTDFGNAINGPVEAKDGGKVELTAGTQGNTITGTVTLSDKDKKNSGGELTLTANNGNNTVANVDAKNGGTLNATGTDNNFANVTADNGAKISATGKNNSFGDLKSDNGSNITATVNQPGGKNTAANVTTANTGTTSFGHTKDVTDSANEITGNVEAKDGGNLKLNAGTKGNKISGTVTVDKTKDGSDAGSVTLDSTGDNTLEKAVTANNGGQVKATGANNTFADITSDNGSFVQAKVNKDGGKNTATSVTTSNTGTTSFGKADGVTNSGNEITGPVAIEDGGQVILDAGKQGNTIKGNVTATDTKQNGNGGTLKATATDGDNNFANVTADNGANISATGKNNTFGELTSDNGASITAKVNAEGGTNTADKITTANTGTTSFGADETKGIKDYGNTIKGDVTATNDGGITLNAGKKGNTLNGPVTVGGDTVENGGGAINLNATDGNNTINAPVKANQGGTLTATGANNTFGDITSDNGANVTAKVNAAGGKNTAANVNTANTGTTSFGHTPEVTDSANEITGNVEAKDGGNVTLDAGTNGNKISGTVTVDKTPAGKKAGSVTLDSTGNNTLEKAVTANNGGQVTATGANNTFADIDSDNGSTVTAKVNKEGGKNTAGNITTENAGTTSFGGAEGVNDVTNEIDSVTTTGENAKVNINGKTNNVKGNVNSTNGADVKFAGTNESVTATNNVTGDVTTDTNGTVNLGGNNNVTGNVASDNGGDITFAGGVNKVDKAVSTNNKGTVNLGGDSNTVGSVDSKGEGQVNFKADTNTVNGDVNTDSQGTVNLGGKNGQPAKENNVTGNVASDNGGDINFAGGANKVDKAVSTNNKGTVNLGGDSNTVGSVDSKGEGQVNFKADTNTVNGGVNTDSKGTVNLGGKDGNPAKANNVKGDVKSDNGGDINFAGGANKVEGNVNTDNSKHGEKAGTVNLGGDSNEVTGNVKSDNGGDITFAADTNKVKGDVTTDAKGTVNLGGKDGQPATENNVGGSIASDNGGDINFAGKKNKVAQDVTTSQAGTVNLGGGENTPATSNEIGGTVKADESGDIKVNGDENTVNGPIATETAGTVNLTGNKNNVNKGITSDGTGDVTIEGVGEGSVNNINGDVNTTSGGTVNINAPEGGVNNITGTLDSDGMFNNDPEKHSAINVNGTVNLTAPEGAAAINTTDKGTVNLNYGNGSKVNGPIKADSGSEINIAPSAKHKNQTINLKGNGSAENGGTINFDLTPSSVLQGDLNNNNTSDDPENPSANKGTINLNLQGNNIFLDPEKGVQHDEQGRPLDKDGKPIDPDAPVQNGISGAKWIPTAKADQDKPENRTKNTIDNLSGMGIIDGTNADINVGKLVNPKDGLPSRIGFETPVSKEAYDNGISGTINIFDTEAKDPQTDEEKANAPRITVIATDYEKAIKGALEHHELAVIFGENTPASAIDKYVDYQQDVTDGLMKDPLVMERDAQNNWRVMLNSEAQRSKFASLVTRVAPMATYGAMTSNMLNDTYNQRMGSALYDPARVSGPWARTYHNRFGQGGEYRSQVTGLQAGYRTVREVENGQVIHSVGLQVDRHTLDFPTVNGTGKVHGTLLDYYYTNISKDGKYTDIATKVGIISNKYDVEGKHGITHGDYHNTAFSASIEHGYTKHFGANGQGYFQPQAQLQYTYLSNTQYTAATAKVHLDDLNSLIGRAGFNAGMKTSASTDAYIRANVLHEFMAKQTITAADITTGGIPMSTSLRNRDTWYTIGLGVTHSMKDNSRIFADVERVFGAHYRDSYRLNFGAQFTY